MSLCIRAIVFFFFKQKTAYEMRISDWISYVCSSDRDGAGPLHMAFRITADSYDIWRAHLTAAGVTMRGEMAWPAGGHSLYFEDPDGHVLELATPGIWPNYRAA